MFLFSMQTLTTLNLDRNQIGTEGAVYLSGELKSNNVRKTIVFIPLILIFLFFHIDTHYTEPP